MGVGVGIDVGTQTDGDVVGEVLEVGDFWAGDTFGDGETLCDDYLDSAVMLQRAAAATFEIHKMKTNVESDAAGASGVEMTLLESPRWDNSYSHSQPNPSDDGVFCYDDNHQHHQYCDAYGISITTLLFLTLALSTSCAVCLLI